MGVVCSYSQSFSFRHNFSIHWVLQMLLLLQESQMPDAWFIRESVIGPLFEETTYSYRGRRKVLEILAEYGKSKAFFREHDDLVNAFQSDTLRISAQSMTWEDNVYDSHLGPVENKSTDSPDSDSSSDSSLDWFEHKEFCTECTDSKAAKFATKAGVNLDPDVLVSFGLCWLRHLMLQTRTPPRLKSCCRNLIRNSIGPVKVVQKVAQTGLPKELQEYVLFRTVY